MFGICDVSYVLQQQEMCPFTSCDTQQRRKLCACQLLAHRKLAQAAMEGVGLLQITSKTSSVSIGSRSDSLLETIRTYKDCRLAALIYVSVCEQDLQSQHLVSVCAFPCMQDRGWIDKVLHEILACSGLGTTVLCFGINRRMADQVRLRQLLPSSAAL